ncbi:MAG: SEC-C metal-binding domain-containing protein [Lysobacteraceae bacterium]
MKRGRRFVHGDKELVEKLGRNDPCPCGSTRRYKTVLPPQRPLRRQRTARFLSGTDA